MWMMMRNQYQAVLLHSPPLVIVAMVLLLCHVVVVQAGHSETIIGIQGKDFVLLAADGSIGNAGAVLTTQNFDKIHTFPAVAAAASHPNTAAAVAAMGDPADIDHVLRRLQRASRLVALDQQGGQHTIVYDCAHNTAQQHQPPTPQPHTSIPSPPESAVWTVDCLAEALRYEVYRRLRTPSPMSDCAFLIAGMMMISQPPSRVQNGFTSSRRSDISNVHQQIRSASKDIIIDHMDDVSDDDTDIATTTTTTQHPTARTIHRPPDQEHFPLQPVLFWLDQYGALQKIPYGAHGHAASLLWSTLDRGWHPGMSLTDALDLMDDCFQRLQERFLFNPSQKFCIKCIDKNGCRRMS